MHVSDLLVFFVALYFRSSYITFHSGFTLAQLEISKYIPFLCFGYQRNLYSLRPFYVFRGRTGCAGVPIRVLVISRHYLVHDQYRKSSRSEGGSHEPPGTIDGQVGDIEG